ncbi:MAG TPA: type II secretion system protein [Chlamydiales bacterium]|nr:type II secretion system protein [Chlamydiales bacterium]
MKKTRKKSMTLLEIMIVIFLIGIIGSVVGYNMKGSLDEGKIFKTKQAKTQLRDLLLLEVAKGESIEEVVSKPGYYLKASGLAKNEKELLADGWGKEFKISVSKDGTDIDIESESLKKFEKKKGQQLAAYEEDERTY